MAEKLNTLDVPVLIVIDDLDRLTEDEIREVFQLVRINADFPNLIYLLLFDRDVVAGALNSISAGRGDEFLEKITPVIFEIPKTRSKALLQQIGDEVDLMLSDLGCSDLWLNSRFQELWFDGISYYFETPRDVTRFLNGLATFWGMMVSENEAELDLVEMFVLEAIRIFDKDFYTGIRNSEQILTTGRVFHGYVTEEKGKEAVQKNLADLVSSSKIQRPGVALQLLENLFPAISSGDNGFQEVWLEERRIGHMAFFDRYFSRNIADNEVSAKDLSHALKHIKQGENMGEFLKVCSERGIASDLLREIKTKTSSIGDDEIQNALSAIISSSDALHTRGADELLGGVSSIYLAADLIAKLLERIPEDKRGEMLLAELSGSPCYLLALELSWDKSNPLEQLISSEDRAKIKGVAIEKIRTKSKSGFPQHHGLGFVMWGWKALTGNTDEPKAWLSTQLEDSQNALELLQAFMGITHMGLAHRNQRRYAIYNGAEEFLDFERIEELTSEIDLMSLTGDAMRALRAFRTLRSRKPDEDYDLRSDFDPRVENV